MVQAPGMERSDTEETFTATHRQLAHSVDYIHYHNTVKRSRFLKKDFGGIYIYTYIPFRPDPSF